MKQFLKLEELSQYPLNHKMFEVPRFADLKHLPWYMSEHGGERGAGVGVGATEEGLDSSSPFQKGQRDHAPSC